MPKKIKPLTATQVKQAKPRDKEYTLSDGDCLILRIRPTGSKVWLFNHRHPSTKRRTNLVFGSYPDLSLAKARLLRLNARELLAAGISPKDHRDQARFINATDMANTLEFVVNCWIEVKRTKITLDHADDIYRSLEKHIFPSLGKTPIGEITAPATIDTIKLVAAKGNLETVKRLCQRLNEVMVYATNTGLVHHNPLAGISDAFQAPVRQHLPALKPEELPELMTALSRASLKFATRCLIEWQLHTMVRPGEAAGTRWDEIDLEQELWTIPAERMKRKHQHTVPLTPQALTILKEMQPVSGHRIHVFPGDRDPKLHINPYTANMALKRMNFGGRLVAHGFRSISSTILNECAFDADVIEAALSHVNGNEVRAAYNRAEYLERRRAMMCWWSKYIEEAATLSATVSRQTVNLTHIR